MIQAARRGEFDFYQRDRALGPGPFVSTPDKVIRAMLEAALCYIGNADPPQPAASQKKAETEALAAKAAPTPRESSTVTVSKSKAKRLRQHHRQGSKPAEFLTTPPNKAQFHPTR